MERLTLTIKRAALLSGLQNMNRPWFYIAAATCLLLIFSLQALQSFPPTTQLYLVPAVAILSIIAAALFNYAGLVVSLVANFTAAGLLYRSWILSGEAAIPVMISLLFYSIVGSIIVSYLKGKEQAYRQNLEWLSAVDCMTETYNHRYFQQRLTEELARARRNGSSLALAFLDIDNFKPYNDQNGHVLGDQVLKKTAAFLKKEVRIHDIVCRYGGDEFVIILPETNAGDAALLAERLIKTYNLQQMPGHVDNGKKLTLSTGISSYPQKSKHKKDLISQSDQALYLAKETGKNNVKIFGEDPSENTINPYSNHKDGSSDKKNFCYNTCKDSLIGSYRTLMDELARGTRNLPDQNLPDSEEPVNNNHNIYPQQVVYTDHTLIIGKVLGLGHTKLEKSMLTSCLDEVKLH